MARSVGYGLAVEMMNRLCSAVAFVLTFTFGAQAQSLGSRNETASKARLAAYSEARQRGDQKLLSLTRSTTAPRWNPMVMLSTSRSNAAITGSFV
jgi:hypothetical protein